MCKSKYETKVMIDAMELVEQIGMMKAAEKLGLSYSTIAQWKRVYNHPEAFPSHAITKHYANTSKTSTSVTPDKIEIKAENNSASVELKVDVKPDGEPFTREIKGSFEQYRDNQRSYMPEFKEFAVALAEKIGDEEATKELGLGKHHISNWRSNFNCELKEARRKLKVLQEENKKLYEEVCDLNKKLSKASVAEYENEQFKKYISNRITDEVIANIFVD